MRIIITGSRGQLGRQMLRVLDKRHDILALTREDLDITSKEELEHAVGEYEPDVLINAAAYTHVDEAESEPELAYDVNVVALKHMATVCAARDILLVHYSTDYVFGGGFSGRPSPFGEEDGPEPLNVYGRSKLEGERTVMDLHGRSIILRSSWLYGKGRNFLGTMLDLADGGREVRVVNDQVGSPTSAMELARVTEYLLERYESGELDERAAYGLYHASCTGQTSWYGFAQRIFEMAGCVVDLKPVGSEEYPSRTVRPGYSVLENRRLEKLWDYHMKSWEEALAEHMQERMSV